MVIDASEFAGPGPEVERRRPLWTVKQDILGHMDGRLDPDGTRRMRACHLLISASRRR